MVRICITLNISAVVKLMHLNLIGTAFFENIPKDLVDEILSQDCNVKYLSLGKYGTYYCLFDNGQAQWNGEIDESLDRLFQSGIRYYLLSMTHL